MQIESSENFFMGKHKLMMQPLWNLQNVDLSRKFCYLTHSTKTAFVDKYFTLTHTEFDLILTKLSQ